MKLLAIRPLHFALLVTYFGLSSTTAAEPKSQYGGFSSHPDSLQVFYDYIHGQEMIPVEADHELRQAIEVIPVDLGTAISLKQEADLRDWLYDFLVAFSSSGNDSLAAEFYLREGVNNPRALQGMQATLEHWGIPQGDTPLALFKAMHRAVIDAQGYEYRFGHAFFRHSTFKVFEMQGRYEHYRAYPPDVVKARFKLQKEVASALRTGERRVFTDIAFVTAEPAASAGAEGPICTPFFCRLVWDPQRAMWRFVEAFYNAKLPHAFLFSAL